MTRKKLWCSGAFDLREKHDLKKTVLFGLALLQWSLVFWERRARANGSRLSGSWAHGSKGSLSSEGHEQGAYCEAKAAEACAGRARDTDVAKFDLHRAAQGHLQGSELCASVISSSSNLMFLVDCVIVSSSCWRVTSQVSE